MDFKLAVANEIVTALSACFGDAGIAAPDIAAALEIPPDTAMGDYAFPCFKLSKVLRKSPMMISDQLAGAIHADFLGKVESVKGYLNFFIDKATWGRLRKSGLTVKVLENITVAAITVNPTSPAGYSFDHGEMASAMQKAVPDIPVIDVMMA